MQKKLVRFLMFLMIIAVSSCHGNSEKTHHVVFKGVYSFGPEVKSFKDCDNGQEFWVTDSSEQLELKYSQLNFEKPYEPVYVEVEGVKIHSGKDGLGSEYDSTLVVKKLIKITKEIPQDMCN
jgi:copper homeostasis protein (lipoprotein)